MLFTFDNDTFNHDLDNLVARLDKFNKPLVVLPTERDVKITKENYKTAPVEHVTFISFDYFMSKKWLADDEYDNIDFFRIDKVLMNKSYGVHVGKATMTRTIKKKEEKDESSK